MQLVMDAAPESVCVVRPCAKQFLLEAPQLVPELLQTERQVHQLALAHV